ncbi:hypothetical protein [Yoonia sp. R2-816]|uniref:hypothetical protein n=1 Tax=Yoonia sp. R2-816 TaxID=3342638 RepID=UPI0037283E31
MIGLEHYLTVAAVVIVASSSSLAADDLQTGSCIGYDQNFERRLSLALTDLMLINECGGATWSVRECGSGDRVEVQFGGYYSEDVQHRVDDLRDQILAISDNAGLEQVTQAILSTGWVADAHTWGDGFLDCSSLCHSTSQEGCAQ